MRRLLACVVLAATTLTAGRAQAWTKTRVTSADAHLYVNDSGEARVRLELGLLVQGGWLAKFEIALSEPALRLDPTAPAALLTQDGSVLTPMTELLPDGRLTFAFPDKRQAAWRGAHALTVTYFTRLPAQPSRDPGLRALRFTLPAWQVDLEDADVYVTAPRGAKLLRAPASEVEGSLRTDQREHDGHSLLHSKRVQLPRTHAFEVAFTAPQRRSPSRLAEGPVEHGGRPWIALFTLCVMLLKLLGLRARQAKSALPVVPLLTMPGWLRVALAVGLAVLAATSSRSWLALGALMTLVTLALQQRSAAVEAALDPRPRIQSRGAAHREASELFGATGWLDATTPLGSCLLASGYALAAARTQLVDSPGALLECALLVTPLFLNATRLERACERVYPQRSGA